MAKGQFTPMEITIYGADDEVVGTYVRSFVPWRLLKKALSLSKSMDQDNLQESDLDAIAGLVVETFGDQFTVQQLNDGADVGEMMAVLQAIMSRAEVNFTR
jgi:23S rRNA G2069 N7-methylase RlmK/C1962 C5-methylase RlmI